MKIYRKRHPEWTRRVYKNIRIGGRTIKEHRWVMEQHLGRPLARMEQVHHVNGDPLDNRLENLQLVTASEHYHIHRQHPA